MRLRLNVLERVSRHEISGFTQWAWSEPRCLVRNSWRRVLRRQGRRYWWPHESLAYDDAEILAVAIPEGFA